MDLVSWLEDSPSMETSIHSYPYLSFTIPKWLLIEQLGAEKVACICQSQDNQQAGFQFLGTHKSITT